MTKVKLMYHIAVTVYNAAINVGALHCSNIEAISHIQEAKAYCRLDLMLTMWYFALHVTYFCLAIVQDVCKLYFGHENRMYRTLKEYRSLVFISIVFPLGVMIPTVFWSLYYYDRELVYPSFMDLAFPRWLNHCFHTNVGFVVCLELVMAKHVHVPTLEHWRHHVTYIGVMFTFIVPYLICLLVTRVYGGFWLYPILNVVPWPICAISVISIAVLNYLVGVTLNHTLYNSNGK